MIKSTKVYDILKWLAQVVLPVLGALYFILDLPSAKEVVGAVVIVDALLGTLLYFSALTYSSENVGSIVATETPKGKTYTLELKGDPEVIDTKDEVRFTVVGAKSPRLALARERKSE